MINHQKMLSFGVIRLILLAWFILSPAISYGDKSFVIFDATLYSKKPNLYQHGIKPITVLYGQDFWKKNENNEYLPSDDKLKSLAKKHNIKSRYIVLDVEHWHVQGHPNRPWIMEENSRKYISLFKKFKAYTPGSRVGYFGSILPISNYEKSISPTDSKLHNQWLSENKRMAPLASLIDVAYPAAYTYSTDKALWEESLLAHLAELKKYFKGEVYIFIWPQYFDHAPAPEDIRLKYIPADYWRFQLETIKKHADGIVIWGGWDFDSWQPQTWNNEAEWWQETLSFLKETNITNIK